MRLMNRDSEAVDLERVLCSITVRLTFIQLLIIILCSFFHFRDGKEDISN